MRLNENLMKFNTFIVRKVFKLFYYIKDFDPRIRRITKEMCNMPKEGVDKDLFIILSGPSLKTQDLSKLKGKHLMFVNKGFMHPLFKELQPEYYIIVDSNLRDGRWPVEWLDQIIEDCPNIRIILPKEWYIHPTFDRFKKDPHFFWQYWRIPFYQIGVAGGCFSYGISQGFSNIFFTGFDGNSCACALLKSTETHFYGAEKDFSNMTTRQHALAFFSTFLQFIDLNDFADYCKDKDIRIFNLTNGGVLDMFPRRDFNDPYNSTINAYSPSN